MPLIRARFWSFVLTIAVAIALFAAFAPRDLSAPSSSSPQARPAPDLIAGEQTAPGVTITPTAAHGAIFQDLKPGIPGRPDLHANHAAAVTVSPDGRLLAILTSGHNLHYDSGGAVIPELSNEYVFLFDITGAQPTQTQVLPIANTFHGIAWGVRSDRLFVSGGKDDLVVEFAREGSRFVKTRTFALDHHRAINGKQHPKEGPWPMAGQVAASPDGKWLLVSNSMNDSISLIDLQQGRVVFERDLRPGKIDPKQVGTPGGTFPGGIVWVANDRAFVASERDREIIAITVSANALHVGTRIPVAGKPVALLANRAGTRVFAALDNTDTVAIIDTARHAVIDSVAVLAPESVYINRQKLGGANPDALALTVDEQTLLVSNGAQNSLAVISLRDRATLVGLIPTGWYPTGVATAHTGGAIYVVNGKSPPGPNADWCQGSPDRPCSGGLTPNHAFAETAPDGKRYVFATNGFGFQSTKDRQVIQMQRAGFLTVPMPDPGELARLTRQVSRNNRFDRPDKTAADEQLFAFLRQRIKHVVYIIKENRSYDQVLGDLEIGNGDPRLTLFPEPISPNHHALARNFVTLDNFLVSGEGSWTGWEWSTAARTSVFAERNDFINLAQRGGGNRQRAEEEKDRDILAGDRDVDEFDAPGATGGEKGKGNIWDSAIRAGLTVRNYGFFSNFVGDAETHLVRDPYALKRRVSTPYVPSLVPLSDPYYYIYNYIPNYWHIHEWRREFADFVKQGSLPNLVLVQLSGDHFGNFETALDGVNTPERQMADNDYALGTIVETIAKSPFADSTLIISIEDDTWDGVDHVDAFRSLVFFAGPYVKPHALVSTRYTTVNVVKTILEVLGAGPVSINDAMAAPMSEIFDTHATTWSFNAIIPGVLRSTQLPLPPRSEARAETCPSEHPHPPGYWARAMADQDFSGIDAGEFGAGNRGLWRGLKGRVPYPEVRTGEDLRQHRAVRLKQFRTTGSCS